MVGAVSTAYWHSLYNKSDNLALALQLNWLYFQQPTTCKHLRVTMSNYATLEEGEDQRCDKWPVSQFIVFFPREITARFHFISP